MKWNFRMNYPFKPFLSFSLLFLMQRSTNNRFNSLTSHSRIPKRWRSRESVRGRAGDGGRRGVHEGAWGEEGVAEMLIREQMNKGIKVSVKE